MKKVSLYCLALLIVIFSFCIFSSCQQEKALGDNELPDLTKAQSLAVVDSIDLESRGILNPVFLRYCDDFLIMKNAGGREELHFLDLRNMTVTEKTVTGQGPNEVGSYYDLMLGNDKNSINYIDQGKWDVYSFNLDSLRINPASQQQWLYNIPKQKGIALLQIPLETERYVYFTGVYTSGEGWIYCYDKQTQEFRSYGDFPDYEELDGLEYMTKSMLFQLMTKATNGKRLVLCRFGTLDFYDIKDDGGLEVFREHHYYMPDIEVYPNGTFAYLSRTTKRGFNYFIASDDEYIYLLYSDKTMREDRENNSKYLFVYDWDGNPIVQYALQKPLHNLALNGTTLYGLSREVEPIVYIYDLKDLLKK